MRPTRILDEARSFGVFDFIRSMTEHDIPEFIQRHKAFIDAHPKGYGLYIWKPTVILDTLVRMNDGDVLLYCDAGMQLNVKGLPRFREYIETVTQPECNLLVFSTNDTYVPQQYVKQDAIMEYFPEFNDTARFTRYYYAGTMLFKKTDKTIALIRDYLALCETERLLDNIERSTYSRVPGYLGNDTDNGLFNLCVAKHGIHADIYPDETNIYDGNGLQQHGTPDWSALAAYPLHYRRLRPGNEQYDASRTNVHARSVKRIMLSSKSPGFRVN